MDVSVLLPVLVRIAEALEAANVIAKANCPGVEAIRPVSSTLVSIPGELFDCSVGGRGRIHFPYV